VNDLYADTLAKITHWKETYQIIKSSCKYLDDINWLVVSWWTNDFWRKATYGNNPANCHVGSWDTQNTSGFL